MRLPLSEEWLGVRVGELDGGDGRREGVGTGIAMQNKIDCFFKINYQLKIK